MLPQICESWLKSYLMQVCKPNNDALIESVEPFKLQPMSILYIYEVFEHILSLWMGIWLHIHIITTTDTSPDLWKLAKILLFASMQIMPLCFGWVCRTFQTAFHVHGISIWGFLSTFSGWGWANGFTLTQLTPQMVAQICESLLKSYLMQVCKPCHYALVEAVELFKLQPMSMSYIYEVFECLLRFWMDIWWIFSWTLLFPDSTYRKKDLS